MLYFFLLLKIFKILLSCDIRSNIKISYRHIYFILLLFEFNKENVELKLKPIRQRICKEIPEESKLKDFCAWFLFRFFCIKLRLVNKIKVGFWRTLLCAIHFWDFFVYFYYRTLFLEERFYSIWWFFIFHNQFKWFHEKSWKTHKRTFSERKIFPIISKNSLWIITR